MDIMGTINAVKDHVKKHKEFYLGAGVALVTVGAVVYVVKVGKTINLTNDIDFTIYHKPGLCRITADRKTLLGKPIKLVDAVLKPENFQHMANMMLSAATKAIEEVAV